LTTIRFPDGVKGKSFYQKHVPSHAPEWVRTSVWNQVEYVLLEDMATLAWLANLACLEFHLSFDRVDAPDMPPELVFDLDPSAPPFEKVVEVALHTKEVLDDMGLTSYVKTSGATGLQVYVPIRHRYTFKETRRVSRFVALYLAQKHPSLITVERSVKNRGDKVYFDYLQHWRGKSLIAPYSPRARSGAPVSTPLTWEELQTGVRPEQFTLTTIHGRLAEKGDLFVGLLAEDKRHDLADILRWIPK
jgi:bifunctional non-homologous end joining protein LigD